MYILPTRRAGRTTKEAIREPMVAREDGKQAKPGRPCHQGDKSRADGCPRGGKTGETGPAVPPRRRIEGRWLPAGRKSRRNQGGRATKGAIRGLMVARGEEKRAKSGRPGHQESDSGADGCPRGRKAGEIRPAGLPRERFESRWLPAGKKNRRNQAGRAARGANRGPMVARMMPTVPPRSPQSTRPRKTNRKLRTKREERL